MPRHANLSDLAQEVCTKRPGQIRQILVALRPETGGDHVAQPSNLNLDPQTTTHTS